MSDVFASSPRIRASRVLLVLALAAAVALAPAARPARAQTGIRTTPDGKRLLISKDVGNERWAISLNLNEGTATGNVFFPGGGDPAFVWCERLADDGTLNPNDVKIRFSCYGTQACDSSPCLASEWSFLSEVELPGEFFLPATDPFAPLRPPGAYCDPLAQGYENLGGEDSYYVHTGGCNYVTAMQRSNTPIAVGDEIFVRAWHFSLTAPSGGFSYMAIQVGNRLIWEAKLPIPCEGGLVGIGGDCDGSAVPAVVDPVTFTADFDAPAGTPVYFHVQNHGENSYNLLEITVAGARALTIQGDNEWTMVSEGLPFLPDFSQP